MTSLISNGEHDFDALGRETMCLTADIPISQIYDEETDSFAAMRVYTEEVLGGLHDGGVIVSQ